MKKDFKAELEKRFKDKSAVQIQTEALRLKKSLQAQEREFYIHLYYLDWKHFYKKIKQFKNSDFKTYISHTYGITEAHCRNMFTAYFQFPEQTKELGAGVVALTIKKVGQQNAALVLPKIQKVKNDPAKVQEVISQNLKSALVKKKEQIDKLPYSKLESLYDNALTEIVKLKAEKAELEGQIRRLKSTARKRSSYPEREYAAAV